MLIAKFEKIKRTKPYLYSFWVPHESRHIFEKFFFSLARVYSHFYFKSIYFFCVLRMKNLYFKLNRSQSDRRGWEKNSIYKSFSSSRFNWTLKMNLSYCFNSFSIAWNLHCMRNNFLDILKEKNKKNYFYSS